MNRDLNLYERYLQGECRSVWEEMLTIESISPTIHEYDQIALVMQETFHRIRKNIDVLIDRLHLLGYQFKAKDASLIDFEKSTNNYIPEDECIVLPRGYEVSPVIAHLENLVQHIPLSLKYFYNIIGSVNLIGTFPSWSSCLYLDSLQVYSPKMAIEWVTYNYEPQDYYGATLAISPDKYHKIGHSGGGVYFASLQNSRVDFLVENEEHNIYFVDYLRKTLAWGGMIGLEKCIDMIPQIKKDIVFLTQDFLAF